MGRVLSRTARLRRGNHKLQRRKKGRRKYNNRNCQGGRTSVEGKTPQAHEMYMGRRTDA